MFTCKIYYRIYLDLPSTRTKYDNILRIHIYIYIIVIVISVIISSSIIISSMFKYSLLLLSLNIYHYC